MSNRDNDGPERPPAQEEVGYRKPPMCRRFKKSGNLKGRPKGAKNRKTIVKLVADERHSMLENGKRRRRTTLEIVLLCLRNMALEDTNVRGFEELHRLTKAYQPQEADDHVGYLVVPAPLTNEEFVKHAEKTNVEADRLHEIRTRELESKP